MSSDTESITPQMKEKYEEKWNNPMKKPYLEKIVLNIGAGAGGEELERAATVLETITGREPKKTLSRSNVKEFDIRKGRPIGVKVTVRGSRAEDLLKRLLIVHNNRMRRSSFDEYGNFGFGIEEHISIPGVEYDNAIGIWGLDVLGRIVRPGMRVKYRRIHRAKIPEEHYVSRKEAQYYLVKKFDVNLAETLEREYY